ncbi:MAG: hypothetical protein A3G81_11985 [Betaproteobacteria bacterium RIFCSPLOWO2_12_FULL_65_14]|nr:MAG: hypothetical protein A3G81_11985 [Betaproteobacteria bacterium RIFCSPLOWO2_12_FULL_65_14]
MLVLVLAAAVSAAAPLAGLAAAGLPVAAYLDFPPRTVAVAHSPFSWAAFALMSLPAAVAIALIVAALWRAPAPSRAAPGCFPSWGWIGAALIALGWLVAWTEGLAPAGWRRQAFTVLWVGYIIAMNALAYRRAGHAPLTRRTGWFLALFPASAAMWWLFEYLNQFVANWHYAGVEAADDWDYFVQGTLPFSTVLPALASTQAWLSTFSRLDSAALPAVRGPAWFATAALVAGVAALAGMALWPESLFSALWLGPLAILAGLQRLVIGESFFAPLARGDWRCVVQPALAALVCGFFWELWNFGSLAKWHYSVPYVQRFELFEMPLLGYAGYIPFGVFCALLAELIPVKK